MSCCSSAGADPHATDDDGNTLLHHAAYGGNAAILRTLLGRGLDVNARNRLGYTPLIQAATDERIRGVRCLLDAGADVHIQSTDQYGMTALKAGRHSEKIAALLQQAGAPLDPRQERVVAQACTGSPWTAAAGRRRGSIRGSFGRLYRRRRKGNCNRCAIC